LSSAIAARPAWELWPERRKIVPGACLAHDVAATAAMDHPSDGGHSHLAAEAKRVKRGHDQRRAEPNLE